MSQHYFDSAHDGAPITVVLGWDRPLGHFFMTIERTDVVDEAEAVFLYSNLDEPEAFNLSLGHYRTVLAGFGIQVPPVMFDEVELDRACRAGNRQVWYDSDGSFREDEE